MYTQNDLANDLEKIIRREQRGRIYSGVVLVRKLLNKFVPFICNPSRGK
jgi:hypothetical protein